MWIARELKRLGYYHWSAARPDPSAVQQSLIDFETVQGLPKSTPPDLSTTTTALLKHLTPEFAQPPPSDLPIPADRESRVYAIEEVRCEHAAGSWVLLYEGKMEAVRFNAVEVSLQRRIGLRFHPETWGVDSSDWWCIPKKRFCYKEVDFGAWSGTFHPGEIAVFRNSSVSALDAGLEMAAYRAIGAKCW